MFRSSSADFQVHVRSLWDSRAHRSKCTRFPCRLCRNHVSGFDSIGTFQNDASREQLREANVCLRQATNHAPGSKIYLPGSKILPWGMKMLALGRQNVENILQLNENIPTICWMLRKFGEIPMQLRGNSGSIKGSSAQFGGKSGEFGGNLAKFGRGLGKFEGNPHLPQPPQVRQTDVPRGFTVILSQAMFRFDWIPSADFFSSVLTVQAS